MFNLRFAQISLRTSGIIVRELLYALVHVSDAETFGLRYV